LTINTVAPKKVFVSRFYFSDTVLLLWFLIPRIAAETGAGERNRTRSCLSPARASSYRSR